MKFYEVKQKFCEVKQKQLYGWGHHTMRDYIKGLQLGRVRTTGFNNSSKKIRKEPQVQKQYIQSYSALEKSKLELHRAFRAQP